MTRLSRNLAVAGLAMASGEAGATTPVRLWNYVTHIAVECHVAGQNSTASAALCARLMPIVSRHLRLPHRAVADAGGIGLILDLRHTGLAYTGTIVASRPAFEGETDERSVPVAVTFDARAPDAGLVAALDRLRKPPAAPIRRGIRRIRPIG
jgi:hypothetical protein